MGKVVRFPVRRHARASSATLKPKTAGEASRPLANSALRNRSDLSRAILPRAFQLLTAGKPTPANDAAAAWPPTASMTESTVSSMAPICSHFVNKSRIHILGIEKRRTVSFNRRMVESSKSLANRLKMTRLALEISAADLCKRIEVKPNRWSQYESGERRITPAVAIRLCEEFKLSMDWIYRADPSQLPNALRLKMRPSAA